MKRNGPRKQKETRGSEPKKEESNKSKKVAPGLCALQQPQLVQSQKEPASSSSAQTSLINAATEFPAALTDWKQPCAEPIKQWIERTIIREKNMAVQSDKKKTT
jgi:hypothetical protein